ncbi:hypothetical protein FTH_1033 [Francisella tularensis subsp. holarctica OSU18]|nr:hypothetical protein FTH_1033 [Francisella tularensis subsp. holarctica OSU18]ADA78712.1 hypothetical protein NE061598_05910 [Francisella tularensis subsp. tularensis NE061598]
MQFKYQLLVEKAKLGDPLKSINQKLAFVNIK